MTENVCVRCGETYLAAAEYKGHYCPECREEWREREDGDTDPKPAGSGRGRSRRYHDDEPEAEEPEPDEEGPE